MATTGFSPRRPAGGKRDGMLLGNAHVVIALREPAVKLDHARAFAHGGGDGHQTRVVRSHVAQPLPNTCVKVVLGGHGAA
jgi:hypothetical protein